MTAALQIGLAFGLVAGLLGSMAALSRIAAARGWHPELPRKMVHVGAGGIGIALPWIMAEDWQVWLMLGLSGAAILALRTARLRTVGGAVHGVARQSFGDLLLIAAVALTFLLHGDRPILYVLPLAVLTLADAAAALAGIRYGRTRLPAGDGGKSVEGSAIFFLVTFILGMVCLLLLTEVPRVNVIVLSLAVAVFATIVEADSWQGFDNLFLPMGVLIFLAANIDAAPADAALRTGLILAAGAAIWAVTKAMGMPGHVARVNALALFLLLSVLYPVNAILPAAALLAISAAAGPARPTEALSSVAALAIVSFLCFAVEPAFGPTAVNFFGLAAAGFAGAHLGLWASGRGGMAVLIAVAVAAGLAAIWLGVLAVTPAVSFWHPDIRIAGSVVIALATLLPAVAPGIVAPQRALRIALVAAGPAGLLLGYALLTGDTA
ncbi:hypothetical protein HKCCE3408_14595 [Rhodobacterales bacterium HKCCE3408]|nr:hypothetical protein [Rhodobacterales bacterium HKCCE3408]